MRFLGFAFASADLLFEVDAKGLIVLAVGAAKKVTGVGNVCLENTSWRVLIAPSDHAVFAAVIGGLQGAARKGPVRCRLKDVPGKPPRYANLYACRLPQLAPNVSCALSLCEAGGDTQDKGLLDRAGFERAIAPLLAQAKSFGLDVELTLIEVASLASAVKTLSPDAASAVMEGLSGVLRAESFSGAAAQLGDGEFAILREKPDEPDTLSARLKQTAGEAGALIEPTTAALALNDGTEPAHTLRALRFTLDHFIKAGHTGDADLQKIFRDGLDATLVEAKAFTALVKARKFRLVFQPIVDLQLRQLHHYEALARFPGRDCPADFIHLAEELELIEDFDLAVVQKVVATLHAQPAEVRIAVNVSGRSFLRPRFIDHMLQIIGDDRRLKERMLIEITESAALVNLELADERIQRLRRDGFLVCIDDFGAGSASLSYLRNLSVDIIKIDGQYVRQMGAGGRDVAMVRHLAALCRELGVRTIAEMIETEAAAETLKSMGVDMGQGYLFSAPLDQLPAPEAPRAARRRGAVDSWG